MNACKYKNHKTSETVMYVYVTLIKNQKYCFDIFLQKIFYHMLTNLVSLIIKKSIGSVFGLVLVRRN